jgi:hypothetical protein
MAHLNLTPDGLKFQQQTQGQRISNLSVIKAVRIIFPRFSSHPCHIARREDEIPGRKRIEGPSGYETM